ncbi:MAG: hypothetical protein HXX13_00850 [Bacteroidetes bacterium]|nr:hypothetical protein [Bacteroidota bacterium]
MTTRNFQINKLVAFLLILLAGTSAYSQEMLGIMNSNYAGINGAILNPATPVSSPYYLDINVLSAHFFAENNYIYFAKDEYRFKRFLQPNPTFPTHPPDGKAYYDYYTNPDKKGFVNLRVMGPSAAVVMGRHAIGFYEDVRSATSARNFSYELAKFMFEGLTFPPQYDINYIDENKMALANLEWAELALNYSYVFRNMDTHYWTAGITVKSLQGYAGAYANINHLDYIVPDHDTLIVNSAIGEAGISLPLDYQANTLINSPIFRGKGVGFDIGVTFQQKQRSSGLSNNFTTLCSQSYTPYVYKIGISLLDIGRIRFKDNAIKAVLDDRSTIWPGISNVNFQNINTMVNDISNHFYGNTTQLVADNKIVIGLPTAFSVQADYNVLGNWFMNGSLIYPIKLMKVSVVRPALLAFAPRYETRLIGIGMVASFYDWSKFHLGINARFRGLFVGTEKLGAFFHFSDFTGMDIYAGIKISFLKGKCRPKVSDKCDPNEYKKFHIKRSRSDMLRF